MTMLKSIWPPYMYEACDAEKKIQLTFSIEKPYEYIKTAYILPVPKRGYYLCQPIFVRFKNIKKIVCGPLPI